MQLSLMVDKALENKELIRKKRGDSTKIEQTGKTYNAFNTVKLCYSKHVQCFLVMNTELKLHYKRDKCIFLIKFCHREINLVRL